MAIEKLVPQYLNKDEDERLVKPVEMTDAINVRVSHETDGTQGIIKNVKGNTAVAAKTTADTIPSSGTNRVIGSIGSDAGRCIYFFLFNTNGSHGIYKYSTVSDTYEKVYQSSVLGFSGDSFLKADLVFDKNGDHLLYFTDDINEPRKINASKALAGGYNANINSATASIADKYLTTCKQPPQTPITFRFQSIDGLTQNHLKENIFQFAYQYVYDDGEVSALSVYSRLALSATHFAYNAPQRIASTTRDNQIQLTVANSDGPVEKIRVFARKNNESTFFRIEEIDNIVGTGTQTIDFRNDEVSPLLSAEESNKMFDAVPRQARAQTFSNNRLVFGNYLEGFDNLEDIDVYSYPVYSQEDEGLAVDAQFQHTPLDLSIGATSITGPTNSSFITRAFTQNNAGTVKPHDGILGWSFGLASDEADTSDTHHKDLVGTDAGVSVFGLEDGTVVDIDLSQFDETDLSKDIQFRFGFSISAEEITIAARNPTDIGSGSLSDSFTVEVKTVDENGDLTVSNEIRLLNPVAKNPQLTSQASIDYSDEDGCNGFITDLIPGLGFNYDVGSVSAAPTTMEQFAQDVGNAFLGATATVEVGHGHINRCFKFFEKDSDRSLASGGENYIHIGFDGFLKFAVTNFWYVPSTQKLRLSLEMIDVSLEASRGKGAGVFAPYFDFNPDSNADVQGENLLNNQIQCTINSSLVNANGLTVKDTMTSTYSIYHSMRGVSVKDTFSEIGDVRGVRTYKSDASHDFGIVYYDHRNRSCGVQKTPTVHVRHFAHPDRLNRNGRTTVDMRIMHEAPSWATKWAPVYSLNTSYDRFLQVTVAEASLPRAQSFDDILAPTDSGGNDALRNIESGGVAQADEAIFLSLRGLEGKPNSYKDGKGANLEYTYREGDILRVLQYENVDSGIVRPSAEFRVLGYKFFTDDETNPIKLSEGSTGTAEEIKQRDTYRRTGHFLIIQDNNVPGFSRADIVQGSDFFSQGCLVEIVSPKKNVEEKLYYEIGQQRDVVEVSGSYLHQGDRSVSVSPSFTIFPTSSTTFTSSEKLFNGDKVLKSGATASGHFFIQNTFENEDGTYFYTTHNSNPFQQSVIGTNVTGVTIDANSLTHGVINLEEGDAFMKTREQMVNKREDYSPSGTTGVTLYRNPTKPHEQLYERFAVEADSASDFFESNCYDIGRPHIETPDQKEIKRISSVTYSEPIVLDSSRLNLSSFNPALFPFMDYSPQKGSIQYLGDMSESLLILQEKGSALAPFSRTLIESAADGQLVTSQQVIGKEVYFAGNYGVSRNPESVVQRFGRVYFCDLESGKVIAISSKGVEPISDNKMGAHFQNRFAAYLNTGAVVQLPCGIDPENDEYIVTTQTATPVQIQIGDSNSQFEGLKPTHPVTTASDFSVHVDSSSGGQITWDEEVLKWDYAGFNSSFEVLWNDAGKGVIILDNLKDKNACFVDRSDITSAVSFTIDVKSQDNRFRGRGLFSTKDGSCNLDSVMLDSDSNNDGSGVDANDAVTVTNLTDIGGDTISYSTDKAFWLTFYSFVPERYQRVHNRFFSFKNGAMFRHNVNNTHNSFYGSTFPSVVEIVSKADPSQVKVYDALSLEGNAAWSAVVSNTEQTTDVTTAMYEERENMYYTVMPKDITANSTNNTSHKVVLGVVESIDGNKVKITSRISNLPFSIGDSAFVLASSSETSLSATITSVDSRTEVTLSSVVGLSPGNVLMAVSQDEINGDKIRDYFAKLRLSNNSSSSVELYAVNTVYEASPIHNAQKQ